MRANLFKMSRIALAASLGLAFNCSTTVEAPLPPDSGNSSANEVGVLPSSSSLPAAGKVLCLLGGQCLYIPAVDCSAIGGQELQICRTESSGSAPSSNSIEQTLSSSSAMPVSSSSLFSGVSSASGSVSTVLCLFNGSCVFIDFETCSAIGGLEVQSCHVSSGSNQPSSSSIQLYSSSIQQQLQSSSSVAITTSSNSSSTSATRCKDEQGREYFCKWDTGCFAIDPAFATPAGQACSALVDECRLYGLLYVNSTVEGEKRSCTGTLISVLSSSSSIVVISGTFKDSRDGKVYKKVTIGTQTWMAENLNYDTPDSKCYDDDPDNCTKYGRLYNWNTAMTACPANWHLSTDAEWKTLTDLVGWPAGTQLQATSWSGTDRYGFTALPGGQASSLSLDYSSYGFSGKDSGGFWWGSGSEEYASSASYWFSENSYISRGSYDKLWWLLSVRCLQN